jgi:hypothetical protein
MNVLTSNEMDAQSGSLFGSNTAHVLGDVDGSSR